MSIVIDPSAGSITGVTQPLAVGTAVNAGDAITKSAAEGQMLGVGQTWQLVTRTAGTTYTNSTGKPIQLNLKSYGSASAKVEITIGGVLASAIEFSALNILHEQTVIIPNGIAYSFAVPAGTRNGGSATELR